MNLPFVNLKGQYEYYRAEFDLAIQSVIDSTQFIMGGPVKTLESRLAQYCGVKHAIACGNGTDALQIALMAIGIQPGDEVITTPFTFIATAEVIALLGAKPVFVDIEEDTYLIDHRLIEEKITNKTRAIIPVSLYGLVPDMAAIDEVAKKSSERIGQKIYVIEDAAQSFGASYQGKKSCALSDIACTSFFPTKPLGCYGDGGALFTDDDELALIMQQIRIHGQEKRYHHVRVGVNSRLDTLQAAILNVKLDHFDEELVGREKVARAYELVLKGKEIALPVAREGRIHVYGQYTVRVSDRDTFIAKLKERGIPTAVHYPVPLNQQTPFKDSSFTPISDKVAQEVVSLPMPLYCDLSYMESLTDL
ncbi:MAG: aminotransferase DegT [Gammaproteobacteria bacterium CG11_big_fil_rev_8_21_14_0_20_46_22]|nr:MAG: aminotransferase DegT [Gammaproteobacteria bacterium CG12_big_fil_rev_8_21_14_0_65_46_12]PIR12110.1 MAG: aminotransferase DegT [Gammaproteobacteria bacterium CG11_big_fil_rev_8_21_14_0_20_46_22]